jgi:hypothetical protein
MVPRYRPRALNLLPKRGDDIGEPSIDGRMRLNRAEDFSFEAYEIPNVVMRSNGPSRDGLGAAHTAQLAFVRFAGGLAIAVICATCDQSEGEDSTGTESESLRRLHHGCHRD